MMSRLFRINNVCHLRRFLFVTLAFYLMQLHVLISCGRTLSTWIWRQSSDALKHMLWVFESEPAIAAMHGLHSLVRYGN